MDASQLELSRHPEVWIQLVLEFGFLFLIGSLVAFAAFCVFLVIDGSMDTSSRKRQAPGVSSEKSDPPRGEAEGGTETPRAREKTEAF